ncbi:MFS transporter [Rhodococcus rhodnii]|nr:MFS transporter [Rhodococcus rhodnii]
MDKKATDPELVSGMLIRVRRTLSIQRIGDAMTTQGHAISILALVCGIGAASLYYIQPLLVSIAVDMRVSTATIGVTVTATQIGNCLGLLFVAPLGDRFDRRQLLKVLISIAGGALVVAALSVNLAMLCAALAILGAAGVMGMIAIPLAADMALDGRGGQTTGYVMSGMLVGILASRSVAGFVAGLIGWRRMLLLGGVLMLVVLVGVHFMLPPAPQMAESATYRQLIQSVPTIIRGSGLLHRRMVLGSLSFCAFSIIWTGLTYGLSAAPFNFSPATIGLFGIAGLAGAAAARGAGTAVDRGWALGVTRSSWMFMVAGAVGMLAGGLGGGVVGIILILSGIVAFDAGMQAQHVTSQSLVSRALPTMRSRGTTAYMTVNLLAGAIGSAVAGPLWSFFGWGGLCGAAALVSLAALMTCNSSVAQVSTPGSLSK